MIAREMLLFKILESEKSNNVITSDSLILEWINGLNRNTTSVIIPISIKSQDYWTINSQGNICNRSNSFFSISGIRTTINENTEEQPIIIQNEVGFLGFICKIIKGTLYFLVQAKIEPGNINTVQISPTIQATYSNFTQKHGGKKPKYIDYFINLNKQIVISDLILSEQSSRFFKKRNRNVIIYTEEDIEIFDSHKWLTLRQIKKMFDYDNLVNMDTRTVLSCIPYHDLSPNHINELIEKSEIKNSLLNYRSDVIITALTLINNERMFHNRSVSFIGLDQLRDWTVSDYGVFPLRKANFEVIFCNINIDGREVSNWSQPLFKSTGKGIFILAQTVVNNQLEFIIKAVNEMGNFDTSEFGPTVQLEYSDIGSEYDMLEKICIEKFNKGQDIVKKSILSEEGGRFYHEENYNVIMNISRDELKYISDKYIFVTYNEIKRLINMGNLVNIQLRNLVSILEV